MQRIFDGNEGKMITRAEAKTGMANYAASQSFTLNQGIKGFVYGNVLLNEILNQEACVGIRIYYGIEAGNQDGNSGKPQLIIVGIDVNGNDITENGKFLDTGLPCPNFCPTTNAIDD